MKNIAKIMLLTMLLLTVGAPVVYAKDTSKNSGETSTDEKSCKGQEDCCNFENIKNMQSCLSEEEYFKFQYTVLEEPIGNTSNNAVADYKSQGTEIRQCTRIVKEISSCKLKTDSAPQKHTYQKFIKKDENCKADYDKEKQDRIYCEPVTLLLVDIQSGNGGVGLLQIYIGLIYRWAAGIVGLIAVFVLILNSIIMITAQGDQGQVDNAKNRIIQSIGGLVILFLASALLYAINPTFFKPAPDSTITQSTSKTQSSTKEEEYTEASA